jgi:hypothetical protein
VATAIQGTERQAQESLNSSTLRRDAHMESEMARPRTEHRGWPEQEAVRDMLRRYLNGFATQGDAARKIGVNPRTISAWKNGDEKIPEWMCEILGYRLAYVPCGTVGVRPVA